MIAIAKKKEIHKYSFGIKYCNKKTYVHSQGILPWKVVFPVSEQIIPSAAIHRTETIIVKQSKYQINPFVYRLLFHFFDIQLRIVF